MSDLSYQFVAGVHPVAPQTLKPNRFDLVTGEPIGRARAWEALPENDLPEETNHWRHAGRLTNEMLVEHLRDLQDRASDEYLGNPTVEGVIAKHVVDTAGESGPTLQVECEGWDDPDVARNYADEAESLWREVADAPTADGEDSFGEWIGSALIEDWLSGGTIDQIVYDEDVPHPIKTRLNPIEIRRLQTPPKLLGNRNTVLGITRNSLGRPVEYHILEEVDPLGWSQRFLPPVNASEVIHGFLKRRRGLVRGYPLLAGTLATAAAIRDLDQRIIDLVHTASMMSVFAYTTSDLLDPPTADELAQPIRFQRRGLTRLPNQLQLDSVQSHQPTPEYRALRRERTSDIGRPAAIPGLSVHMDASGHNYSSARFDDRGYWRAVARWQGHCARRRMNPYVRRVLAEAESKNLIPQRQGKVRLVWQWPKTDGIDPLKDALSRRQRMQNLSASPYQIAAEEGNDTSQIIRDIKRFHDELQTAGIPPEIITPILTNIYTGAADLLAVANTPDAGP